MRIGFFSDRYLPMTDGVAVSIESFRQELEKRGHQVYIFAPKPNLRYTDPSPHIIRFPAVKGLFFEDYLTTFFFPPQVMRKIDRLKLDLVHFHTPGQVGLFGAYYAIKHDIPLVTTYHTDLYEYVRHYPAVLPGVIALTMLVPAVTGGGMAEYRDSLSSIKPEHSVDKWNQKIVERGVTMVHNQCDLVISPSEKIAKQLRSWKTKSRIAILPTGVDKITTTPQTIAAFRREYHLSESDEVILYVGRIGTEKNLGLLISAFEIIARQNANAKLLCVGTGEDLDQFREAADRTGHADRIIFAGRISDRAKVGAAFEICSLFAFPSVADTQGLVLNEAAQAAKPLVIVDQGITDVLVNGQNGYITKPQATKFASAILTILRNTKLQQQMGQRSQDIAADYTTSHQTTKLLRLYEETIHHHGQFKAQNQPHETR